MNISNETKIFGGIFVATAVIIVGAIFFLSRPIPKLNTQDVMGAQTQKQGSESAKVVLVEFSDFECPACKFFKPAVDEVLEKYGDKILFVYRHFPLMQHKNAYLAAQAAEAAGEQGKFWEAYDYLFENQEKFNESFIKNMYGPLKLDKETFLAALDSKKIEEKINTDQADGKRIGVDATPTFYLNGRKLMLQSSKELIKEVEREINR